MTAIIILLMLIITLFSIRKVYEFVSEKRYEARKMKILNEFSVWLDETLKQ